MTQTGGRTLFCVRVMEKTSTGFCRGSRAVIPLEVTYECSRWRPNCLFCCFIEVTMTVVKSVSDGLGDCETQLNLKRPLRISPGPRHLSRPLAAISTYANKAEADACVLTERSPENAPRSHKGAGWFRLMHGLYGHDTGPIGGRLRVLSGIQAPWQVQLQACLPGSR